MPLAKPDLYVVARFLDKLWHPDGAPAPRLTRSRLQAATRLNYDLFLDYLTFLQGRGLVAIGQEDGRDVVHITSLGLEAHRRIVAWILEVVRPSRL